MKAISAGTDNVYETVLELINKNPELKPDVVLSDEDTLSKMSDEEYANFQPYLVYADEKNGIARLGHKIDAQR